MTDEDIYKWDELSLFGLELNQRFRILFLDNYHPAKFSSNPKVSKVQLQPWSHMTNCVLPREKACLMATSGDLNQINKIFKNT